MFNRRHLGEKRKELEGNILVSNTWFKYKIITDRNGRKVTLQMFSFLSFQKWRNLRVKRKFNNIVILTSTPIQEVLESKSHPLQEGSPNFLSYLQEISTFTKKRKIWLRSTTTTRDPHLIVEMTIWTYDKTL